jgi:outer membrane murein-binding lipoprotein Lpp
MNNQFKKLQEELDQEEEVLDQEEIETPKKAEKEGSATVFFRKLFTEGVVTKEAATDMLPYLIFLCVLGMIYIANSHMATTNMRNIDKLSKDIKELSSEYKSLKSDLMFKSKLSQVAAKVDTLGLKQLIEPPKKIVVNSNEH